MSKKWKSVKKNILCSKRLQDLSYIPRMMGKLYLRWHKFSYLHNVSQNDFLFGIQIEFFVRIQICHQIGTMFTCVCLNTKIIKNCNIFYRDFMNFRSIADLTTLMCL